MEIEVSRLKPGMVLEKEVLGKSGKPIVPKNTKLTDLHIEFMKKFLFEKVSVSPLHKSSEQHTVDTILETSKRKEDLERKYVQSVKLYKRMFQNVRNNVSLEMYEIREQWIPIFQQAAYEPLQSILNLIKNRPEEDLFYYKSVAMTFLTVTLAVKLGYEKKDWVQIGFAALLSDLGIAKLEEGIDSVRDENWRLHPIYSYKLIEDEVTLNKYAKLAILQHHEYLDGTGFPSNMKEGKIHPYAQIIAVSDYVVTEYENTSIQHIVKLLDTYKKNKFSKKVIDVFMNEIK